MVDDVARGLHGTLTRWLKVATATDAIRRRTTPPGIVRPCRRDVNTDPLRQLNYE
jgi:hypothetical protein